MSTVWDGKGWLRYNSEGVPTIYLAISDEGMVTAKGSGDAAVAYRPRILSPETFSIRRRPLVWTWGDTSTNTGAAFAQMKIDNYDGEFDFLLRADLRDATVVMKMPTAAAFASETAVTSAPTVATAILDDAVMDREDVITVTLKDILARLDRPLLARYNPPFVEESAAGRMVPLTLGACRNVAPLLVDEPERTFQIHDQALTNISSARDMGAALDVYANPPQYQPALNNSGIQLETLPAGKFLVDVSSEGTQTIIPGASDVLLDVGTLSQALGTTWTAPYGTNAPSGWTYVNTAWGTFDRVTSSSFMPQNWGMLIQTHRKFDPRVSFYGCPVGLNVAQLLPGRTYRITITIDRTLSPQGFPGGGIYLTTDYTSTNSGISGGFLGPYLQAPSFGGAPYTFIHTTPADGTTRTLYVVGCGDKDTSADVYSWWHGLRAELLGQFIDLPMTGITLAKYFTEILANRAGEPTSVWSSADLDAIDEATGYLFGNHYDDQPNILKALRDPLDSFCATISSDNLGVLRTRRLVDPKLYEDLAVASFDSTNVKRPIAIYPDRARYLTTLFGARRNWTVSGPSDFVSDFNAVPAEQRARFSRTSQFQLYAARTPAGQYSNAIGAKILDTLLDLPGDAQTEGDRVVGIFSPTAYDDGTVSNGKRNFVQFTVFFDDFGNFPNGTVAPQELLFGDIVLLTYPTHGFDRTPIFVAGTDFLPFAQQLTIWGFF